MIKETNNQLLPSIHLVPTMTYSNPAPNPYLDRNICVPSLSGTPSRTVEHWFIFSFHRKKKQHHHTWDFVWKTYTFHRTQHWNPPNIQQKDVLKSFCWCFLPCSKSWASHADLGKYFSVLRLMVLSGECSKHQKQIFSREITGHRKPDFF